MTTKTSDTIINWTPIEGSPGPSDWSQGPPGSTGAKGDRGEAGTRGTYWWNGNGPPATVGSAQPQDYYLDLTTGDVYVLS